MLARRPIDGQHGPAARSRGMTGWLFTLLILLGMSTQGHAGDPVPPAALARWIPAGWAYLASAQGDLDRDGQPDAVLVMTRRDPRHIRRNAGLGGPTLDTNPRRLQVLWGSRRGFRTGPASDEVVPPASNLDDPCLMDPFEARRLSIARGILILEQDFWLSCGSYGVHKDKWHYRYDAAMGRFQLVALERLEFMRNQTENDLRLKADFLHRRVRLSEQGPEDDRPRHRKESGRVLGKLPVGFSPLFCYWDEGALALRCEPVQPSPPTR